MAASCGVAYILGCTFAVQWDEHFMCILMPDACVNDQ